MSNRLIGFDRLTGGSITRGGLRSRASRPRRPGEAQAAVLALLLALGAVTLSPGAGALPSQTAAPPRPVWVGTSDYDGIGIFRSTDGGEHWLAANNGLPAEASVEYLAVDPSSPQIAYAGTHARGWGLYRTTDGGNSWRRLPVARTLLRVRSRSTRGVPRSCIRTTVVACSGRGIEVSTGRGSQLVFANRGIASGIALAVSWANRW